MSEDTFTSLEERMDAQLIAFGAMPEDENQKRKSWGPPGVLAGAALAGGGYSAYKSRGALMKGGKMAARAGLRKTAGGAEMLSGALAKSATGGGAAGKIAGKANIGLLKGSNLLRKTARAFSREEVNAVVELAERIARIELEAGEEDNVIDFGRADQFRDQAAVAAAAAKKKVQGAYSQAAPKAKQAMGWAKANPRMAGGIGGGLAVAAGGAALLKRSHDKRKRRDELLARFKGGKA